MRHHDRQPYDTQKHAVIVPTAAGWHLYPPGSPNPVKGAFATEADAWRRARQNGWTVESFPSDGPSGPAFGLAICLAAWAFVAFWFFGAWYVVTRLL